MGLLAVLVELACLLAGPSTAAAGAPSLAVRAASGSSARAPYGDPMFSYVYEGRVFDGYDSKDRAAVNYAVAWLRVTDYTAAELRIFDKELYSRFDRHRGEWNDAIYRKVRTAAEIEQQDPGLFAQLKKLGLQPGDVTLQVVARSARYRGEAVGHSEELILRRLGEIEYTFKRLKEGASRDQIDSELQTRNGVDITPERLIGGASEREPCDYPGGPRCARYSKGMRFLVPYGTKEEQGRATGRVQDLIQKQNEWRDQNGDGLFDPPPRRSSGRKAAPRGSGGSRSPRQLMAGATIGAPGGIDFSTVELRHLSAYPGDRLGFSYEFTAQASSAEHADAGSQSLRGASDSFYVWLALPPSTFWVNLNPNEPDRVIDKRLAGTDVGRILLEADDRLKKVDATLFGQDNEVAKRFRQRIQRYGGAGCFEQRLWITPGPADVYSEGDDFYILNAPLEVKAEPFDVGKTGNRSHAGCSQPADVSAGIDAAYNDIVLPEVVREVNESPEFAALRRVYLTRVAAEWVRQRTALHETGFEYVIDSGDVSKWPARQGRSPQTIYEGFVRNYDQQMSCIQRPSCTPEEFYRIKTGGVDFGKVVERNVSKQDFEARWRSLSAGRTHVKGASVSQSKSGTEVAPVKPKAATSSRPWGLLSDLAGSNRNLGIELIVAGMLALLVGWRILDRRRPTKHGPPGNDSSGKS
ncbi:hypothetical protein ACO0M4_29100 [Streptomyces sp. RGM 3693]|uniref:hypothetical protein n=1 Tax=Streptomyces sp. RGM 3693 TaxID=3413284 RepID=UPI003D282B05